jgi:four helix bundle protein
MEGPIYRKSQLFSLKVIALYKFMQVQNEVVLSKQLLASATSIGANIREASAASSRKDFIHKMAIASKEARETKYWLELIQTSEIVNYNLGELLDLNNELIKILNSIILTSQGKPKNR